MDDSRLAYKAKTVMVTGGAGFIGSNLTRALSQAEAKNVVVVDDLSAAQKWNLPVAGNITFIQGSIADDTVLKQAFAYQPEYIFHLAAHFANQNSVDHSEKDLLTNGQGTLKVLNFAKSTGVARVFYASSSCSVYGGEAPLPLREDFVSLHMDTPYQIHKLLGELYCNYFFNYYKMPVTTARFFNVYGPGEIPGAYRNVIPNFLWWAMHGKPLPITGTGEETRDFTFVGDVVDGILRMGVKPEAIGGTFNLASNVETRIIDLANLVNGLTGNAAGVTVTPRRRWDKTSRRCASIEKAYSVLGYAPKVKVQDGIKQAYNWIKTNHSLIEGCARF